MSGGFWVNCAIRSCGEGTEVLAATLTMAYSVTELAANLQLKTTPLANKVPRSLPPDTNHELCSVPDRFLRSTSAALRDSVLLYPARLQSPANKNVLVLIALRTPIVRCHQKQSALSDCAVGYKTKISGHFWARTVVGQSVAHQSIQPLKALAHVCGSGRQIDPRRWTKSKT